MPNWKKIVTSGSDASLNSLNVSAALSASGLAYPNSDGLTDQLLATDGSGTLFFKDIVSVPTASLALTSSYSLYAVTASYAENFNATGSITINGYTLPLTDGEDGQTILTDGEGTLEFGDIKVYTQVKNISGTTLLKGTPVHATASASPPSGNLSEVIAASASLASSMPATFILDEELDDGEEGRAISVGYINNVNTTGFTVGDVVYVGPNGGYTNVKPTGSNLIQNLGVVTRVHQSNGAGFIYGSGRSNDVPNITQGYAWVGNVNQVATAVPTASFFVDNSHTSSYADSFVVNDTLLSTQENTDVDTGTETIATVSTTFYDGAFFDYIAKDGTNYRAGTVMAVWDGSSVEYTDNSTLDIGNTSNVTLAVDISGTDARLRAIVTSDNWNIKAFVRAL